MPYQNNNNRLTPEAVEDRKLKPAATPTDKSIKYAVDNSKAAKWSNTANALVSLGKGIMEMDVLWHYQGQENAIKAIAETEAKGGNKNDWADVSKNIKGLAIFNPYNDDAFRQIQAYDIYRASVLELMNTQEIEKLDENSFNKLVNDTRQKMMEGFKETGLTPKDYGHSVEQFHNQMDSFTQSYIINHKKYMFDQLNVKETDDTSFQLEASLMEAEYGQEAGLFRKVLEDKINHLSSETGIVAPDTQAKVIIGGIKNYIARNTGQINDAEVLAAISDLKLGNGQALREVVPNYDIMIKDLLGQAREANIRQMKAEIEIQDFQQQQTVNKIVDDFTAELIQGKLNDPAELQKWAADKIKENNINGVHAITFFKELAAGRKTWAGLKEIETDPETAARLGMKAIDGTLTRSEIIEEINNNKLNYDEGFKMIEHLQKEEQKEKTALDKRVDEHLKRAVQTYIKGTNGDEMSAIIKYDPAAQKAFMDDLNNIRAAYEKTGNYEAFNNNLYDMQTAWKKKTDKQEKEGSVTGYDTGYEVLKSTPRISNAQWLKRDTAKSTQALRKMGIVRTQRNFKSNVTIASPPSPSRKIKVTDKNGKTYFQNQRHTGYDFGGKDVYMGRPVYSPLNGTVVGVSLEKDNNGMGNMVLIKCANGKLVKYMHLQNTGLPSLGQQVTTKNPIGYIGNTGRVGNKAKGSLHVEFYNENKQWITAWEFLEKGKKKG